MKVKNNTKINFVELMDYIKRISKEYKEKDSIDKIFSGHILNIEKLDKDFDDACDIISKLKIDLSLFEVDNDTSKLVVNKQFEYYSNDVSILKSLSKLILDIVYIMAPAKDGSCPFSSFFNNKIELEKDLSNLIARLRNEKIITLEEIE